MFSTLVTDEKERLICTLCPHGCNLSTQRGRCGVRGPKEAVTSTISSLCLDPIEKKPIFHLNPTSRVLSVGFFGCNMACMFCQNAHLLKAPQTSHKPISVDQVKARLSALPQEVGLALTYSEPLIHVEVAYELLAFAKAQGRFTVVVTNGLINQGPLKHVLPLIDGMNIDLKAPNQALYKALGGDLPTVLNTIRVANDHCHVEVTSLIVTDFNDDINMWHPIFEALGKINPNLVLHLSRYYPVYHYTKEATAISTLKAFYQSAKTYLTHVYMGNVPTWVNETRCGQCKALMVTRTVYETQVHHMICPKCQSTQLIHR